MLSFSFTHFVMNSKLGVGCLYVADIVRCLKFGFIVLLEAYFVEKIHPDLPLDISNVNNFDSKTKKI